MNATRNSLARLLQPRSLAVVGASPEPGSVGNLVLSNLLRFQYSGELHLVSRSRDEVLGRTCVRSIDDLPHGIDAAIIVAPQVAIADAIAACGRRGIGGAVVFASGFAEIDEAGLQAQHALAELAEQHGVALLGPNCMGFVNFIDHIPMTFEQVQPRAVGAGPRLGVIAQSGAMSGNLRQAMFAKGLNVAFSLSTGNEAVLGAEDLLAQLIDSPDIDAFALFVEMIRKPEVFLQAAERARAAGKPVVLMHPGRSARARQAAQSHTGALAGDYRIMRTLVEREAVVVVDSLDELFDVAATLARYPLPVTQAACAVASNSGAVKGIAIDFCEDLGLPLADLHASTIAALGTVLPDFATVENPLDLTSQGMQQPELFGHCARILLEDDGVGSLLMPLMGGGPTQQMDKVRSLLPVMADASKPVVFAFMGDASPVAEDVQQVIGDSQVPFFRSPDRALRALAKVHEYGRLFHAAGQRREPALAPSLESAPSGPMAEYKGKQLLAELGISVPDGRLARSRDEALAIAADIGYPVVLKAQADRLTHKSDIGGVAIHLGDDAALVQAWDRMQAALAQHQPGLSLDGLLVERMSPAGLELVVGARRDPAWGVVLMVGLGGVYIEVLKDFRLMAADLDLEQIIEHMDALKGAALLHGVRGRPGIDQVAVARVVSRVADLMLHNRRLLEIDINPLLCTAEGCVALDALMVMD
ncbi:acetate--CoA ligase family protein [Pseudomonas capeferrum]|uniref:acetate--CoA ligase family protein n=1 Tax=Pseudomonas capeferrum TaxID=1495066 RepID=UPI0015E3E010|nr:acetate--CoA ligase family protein [Pseudomonas capeferrum]MBA1204838.1 acetate--CoA ligase family protein [Pseudomonas capeferrum]